jgi:uncharacterized GH25 family protein
MMNCKGWCRLKSKLAVAFLLLVSLVVSASAHDLFLKLDTYFLQANSKVAVRLMNGTFQKSDGKVRPTRLQNVSLIAPDNKLAEPPLTSWRDDGNTSLFDLNTAEVGTYLVGISTKHNNISLKAADFNDYLKHDGIPDILQKRREAGELNKDAHERYSKHVKAIFQVGGPLSDNFKTPLNYPVEIIPQQNPYSLKAGEKLEVLCVLNGKPIPNQFVIAGWEVNGKESLSLSTRADGNGIARFELKSAGKWYIKFIHMAEIKDPKLNYESNWASITFEIK